MLERVATVTLARNDAVVNGTHPLLDENTEGNQASDGVDEA